MEEKENMSRNPKPKQMFDDALAKAVIEYHEWHHDKKIEIKAFICDSQGTPNILTRVVDEGGKKMSCLLDFDYHFSENEKGEMVQVWDVNEVTSCETKDEYQMVQNLMNI